MATANTYETLCARDPRTIDANAVAAQLEAIRQVSPDVTAEQVAAQFRIVAKIAKNSDREDFERWANGGEMPVVPLTPGELEAVRGGYSWNIPGTMRWWEIAIVAMT